MHYYNSKDDKKKDAYSQITSSIVVYKTVSFILEKNPTKKKPIKKKF